MPSSNHRSTPFYLPWAIWLLTSAIKFRKAGVILLFSFSLINCYLMLFKQQNYIAFLEHYVSPDGHISNINMAFFDLQAFIILISIFWLLIDQLSIDLINQRLLHDSSNLDWRHSSIPYVVVCVIWLLISYAPFLFLDSETIKNLIKEDGFFQNFGAIWLFISSVLFFYLFNREKENQYRAKFNKGRNIWFLILGLLFLFGAGEEISWGQRIFDFKTPEFMRSNTQSEFTIHNLPWLQGMDEKIAFDKHGILVGKPRTGFIATHVTARSLMLDFCFFSFIAIPWLYSINTKIRDAMFKLRLPIAPTFISVLFIVEYSISIMSNKHHAELFTLAKNNTDWDAARINQNLVWAAVELNETFISFLFMIIAVWFINYRKP